MKLYLKTMIISLLLILSISTEKLSAQVSTWDGTWQPWTHGTGTEADPFLIENAQQLAYLAYIVNYEYDANVYHYKLMIDVNLNGNDNLQWTPIGHFYCPFYGHIDGNSHTISGLFIKATVELDNYTSQHIGFIGYADGAVVENLNISGEINCWYQYREINTCYAGGFVGYAKGMTLINNCNNNCNVYLSVAKYSDNYSYTGGLIGYCDGNTIITNCSNNATISSSASMQHWNQLSYAGGISGYGGNISNCFNCGEIRSEPSTDTGTTNAFAGGIAGYGNTINSCYNKGTIISNGYHMTSGTRLSCSGGITGSNGTISSCYNVGNLHSDTLGMFYSGGIVGHNGSVINSYYLSTCGGDETNGGIALESTEMQTASFVDLLNDNSCDFARDAAPFINDGYPLLIMKAVCVHTGLASDLTDVSAILHGSISSQNITLIKGFEYRKVGDLSFISIEVEDNVNNYSVVLNELDPNSTYEYRAFAYFPHCDETVYGSTISFCESWLFYDTICIYNADMLRWVSEQCKSGTTFEGKYIKLMNDITLPLNVPNNMTSIGSYPDHPFKGTFDGNGKLITNLYIDQPNTPYQGFFGYTLNANLYNVGLVNITASGRNYTGGMVAYAENTHMRDCYVNGGTLFALSYCGGLVGYQEQGTNSIISGCYNTCTVSGNHYVGGLVGFSNYGTVRNSYVAAPVSGQGNGIGAIIGGANEVLMYYCYFSTEITGQTNAIGENNFKDGGEGLTNTQMRDPQFVNTLNQNLVTPVWMADYTNHINNGFPIIKWQRPGTGVEEHDTVKSYVSFYPNPANSFVTIQSDEPSASLKHMEIYDIMGRKVMSKILDGQTQEICIDKLVSGIYHVRIQTCNGGYTNLRLIVQ